MGKNRILRLALAALALCAAAVTLCVAAYAVDIGGLKDGMTLAPGSEVSVPESEGEYSYAYDAGSCGELAKPIEGALEPGDTLTLLTAKQAGLSVYEGWQFSGWYCVLSAQKLTVFAQYSAQPAITLSEKAAEFGLETSAQRMCSGGLVTVTVPEKYAGYVDTVTANGEPAQYKDGVYVFTMPEGNVTVDLSIREDMCRIVYDANGGSFSDGSELYSEYLQISSGSINTALPAAPQRKNYVFLGWGNKSFTAQAGQALSMPAQPFSTVYFSAHWSPDPETAYTITLDAGDGSTQSASLLAAPGDSVALPDAWRDGYSFVGWSTSPDGGGETAAAGQLFTPEDDCTLYARWTPAECTVTVSIKHLGRAVSDVSAAVITDSHGRSFVGEDSGTGVFVFRNIPDGDYVISITARSGSGSCGGIQVRGGVVISSSLEAEIWR